ncbi:HlyD family efflux transporter periplasmic adaptor subunit [Alteromonas sp. IB21]|uniref:HlyD family secretion protein n=1 Tax=Alteromonas sp. IB21 TaxID=2779369 RepID=UPI0018E748E6|nr:HlyD family efflux transporter periplasmic adaptor subunit [Alteromonas sp. IB21]MBJ2128636.1 HlyD family efflux transporter periplasmic adaptor subunit [Alteromonas sp. IB21]
MRTGLFRKEAVDEQSNTLDGSFLMTPKPVFTAIALLLVVWIVAVIIYLYMGSYARKASVNGWLEPSHGVFKLYSDTRRGKVIDVLVQEGEQVEAGTPLITVDYGNRDASGNPVSIQLLEELEAKRERTSQNITRLQALHLAQVESLSDQLSKAERTLDDLDAIVALSETHWNMAFHQWETAQSLLNRGHISRADFENKTLQRLTAEQQLTLAKKDRRLEQTNIAKLHHEIATLPKRQANEIANLENALSDLQQQIVSHKSSAKETIYAPRSGQVSGLRVKKGYTVDSARPLLTLLPINTDIQARIAVPVRSAGFLRKGQALHIRYDAFPYQKFGVQTGEITNISPSLILPGELIDIPISINEPAYLVTAKLSANEILAYGNNISLKAGMTFSADVHLSQRTLMEWLMEPLYSITGKL